MKNIVMISAIILLGIPAMAQFRCGQPLLDERDGQEYPTVWRQGQCWMAKNLNYGNMVFAGAVNIQQTDNSVPEKFCYDNDPTYCQTFGGLYQWDELMQYARGPQVGGLCPEGWHVPTDEEFETLASTFPYATVGLNLQTGGGSGFEFQTAGYAFYSASGWTFNGWGSFGGLRTSDDSTGDPSTALVRYYYTDDPGFYVADHFKKSNAYSARCIYSGQAVLDIPKTSVGDEDGFRLYPNPATDQAFIEIHSNTPVNSRELRILDLQGRLLRSQILQEGLNTIDLTGLASGLVIVQVPTPEGLTQVQQLHIY